MIKEPVKSQYLSKSGWGVLIVLLMAAFAIDHRRTSARLEPDAGTLTNIVNIETLRQQFNRDAGNVRLIILVAPT